MKISVTSCETGTCALGPCWHPSMSSEAKGQNHTVSPRRDRRPRSSPHEGAQRKCLSSQDLGVDFMPFGTLPHVWHHCNSRASRQGPGRPIPNPDSRRSAAVCRFGSFLVPRPSSLRACVPPSRRAALIVAYCAFWTMHSSPVMGVPRFPVPCSPFPVPGFWELSTTSYAHASMSQTIKFESKSIKKATFSVKKGSKRRAFRHAHLNILGGHPLWR